MKTKILVILFSFSLIFSSCTTVYVPSEANTPVFKDKYDFRAGLSYGNSGLNLQTAFSFTDHLGIIASGSYVNVHSSQSSLYQKYGEVGFGYFRPPDKKGDLHFEIFSGLGFGEARSTEHGFSIVDGSSSAELSESGKYYKIFLQPEMAMLYGWVDVAFALRLNYLRFTGYSDISHPGSKSIPASFGMEPSVSFIMGDTPFKMKFQIGLSEQGTVSGNDFGYTPFFTHVGFVIAF